MITKLDEPHDFYILTNCEMFKIDNSFEDVFALAVNSFSHFLSTF